ncbi:NAD(P)/FAD-dependent oxidoreductase [Vitreimonas flagellata]|uniref:NAD(P)/FAD-dependent oxidoreductase n=1 Tax=Vitreimonas flagellata TaxID=2560861 RepID=UPI001074E1E5|nr:FAD-dependent oxidoreductase [Vitreimonas flagellata]
MTSTAILNARTLGTEPLANVHWVNSAQPAPACPKLDGDTEADIVILGAGYTGLVAALSAAGDGRRIVVLEAAPEPGFAASGRNAGAVAPMMWGMKKTPAQIAAAFPQHAPRMNRAIATSGAFLRDFISRYGVECEAHFDGYLLAARTPDTLAKAKAAYEAWVVYGGHFELLSAQELTRHVHTEAYAGALRAPDAGYLNPLSFSRGLAAAAQDAGVAIHCGSPVLSAKYESGVWNLRTPGGVVRATTLLAGMGAYGGALVPRLQKESYEVCSAVVATDPLPNAREIMPGGMPMADLDDAAVFAPMIDARDCLVVSMLFQGDRMSLADAERIVRPRLARALPALASVPFTKFWGGKFLMTADGVPHLLQIGPNAYAAQGCNGMGHSMGVAVAHDLGRLGAGAAADDLVFPVTMPKPAPMHGLMTGALRRVMAPMMNRKVA